MKILRNIHLVSDRWISRLENLFVTIAAILLLVMVVIITMSVVGRYFFNTPFAWTVEVSEYIMIFVTFFIASWIFKLGGHVGLDLLIDVLPPAIKKIINLITLILGLAACSILGWFSMVVTLDYYERNVVLLKLIHMPQYIVIMPIVIGCLLLFLRFIVSILGVFSGTAANGDEASSFKEVI
jgi:C4-dicarboxylate transporter, DctQ subunit